MKYDKLTIIGLPKKFKVYYALDYLYPGGQLPDNPDEIIYDEWPTEGNEGEDAMMAYEYYKSATGVYVAYNETVHALSLELSPWASDADVRLYVKLVNMVLMKHPRTKLYAQYDILKGLTEDDEKKMIADRQSYVKRLLKNKEGFTMEGLFHGCTGRTSPPCTYPRHTGKRSATDVCRYAVGESGRVAHAGDFCLAKARRTQRLLRND